LQDIRNQSDGTSISDTAVSSTDAGCNNRRTSAYSYAEPPIVVRSIWISEPSVSSSDANQRSQLPPNRFRSCPSAFHRAPHSKEYHTQARRHCNTVSLGVHVPSRLACWHWFARRLHPNSKCSVWLDPLSSGCRFRFFLLEKGIQLIQLNILRLFWYGSRWQLIDIITDPIRHRLLIDLQNPAYGS